MLKVVDGDEFKDIEIGEGCMFMLPPNTPHNPCRFADTIGLVVERKRPAESIDRLRWYCRSGNHSKPTVIYEESFHCEDLGTRESHISCCMEWKARLSKRATLAELKPVIQRWQNDAQLRKCKDCGWEAPPK